MSTSLKDTELRSPIKATPLPQAGESLKEQFNDLLMDVMMWWSVAVVMFAIVLFGWWQYLFPRSITPWWITCWATAAIVFCAWRAFPKWRKLRNVALGMKGERAVADVLDQLRERGYRVYHDVPGDRFNVDHVIIGPGGVFAIETKTHRKGKGDKVVVDGEKVTVGGHTPDRDPVEQAKASARHIRNILKAQTGADVWVKPVILYPGWYVTHKTKPSADIYIASETYFIGSFDYEHADERLNPEEVSDLALAMERHLRNPKPLE